MSEVQELLVAQRFDSSGLTRRDGWVKPFFLAFAVLAVVALEGGDARWVTAGLIQMGVLAASIGLFALRRRLKGHAPDQYWYATGFSAAILGGMTLGALLLWDMTLGRVVLAASAAGALLAGATSFCAGRLIYVLLFRKPQAQACD
jgi:hypothetical protein